MELDTELRNCLAERSLHLRPSDQQQRDHHGQYPEDNSHLSATQKFSLPQADGGKDAWLFLAACFVVEALVWGT
jgi:hypothetical protein